MGGYEMGRELSGKTIKLISILDIIVVLLTIFLFIKSKIYIPENKLVLTYKEVYKDNWNLIEVDDELPYGNSYGKTVYISFEQDRAMSKAELVESISDIFHTYKKVFLEDNRSEYDGDRLYIKFDVRRYGKFEVTYLNDYLFIEYEDGEIYIDDLAAYFPDMNGLKCKYLVYRDLSTVQKFENLEEMNAYYCVSDEGYQNWDIKEYEFEYPEIWIIKDYFPECIIRRKGETWNKSN